MVESKVGLEDDGKHGQDEAVEEHGECTIWYSNQELKSSLSIPIFELLLNLITL